MDEDGEHPLFPQRRVPASVEFCPRKRAVASALQGFNCLTFRVQVTMLDVLAVPHRCVKELIHEQSWRLLKGIPDVLWQTADGSEIKLCPTTWTLNQKFP